MKTYSKNVVISSLAIGFVLGLAVMAALSLDPSDSTKTVTIEKPVEKIVYVDRVAVQPKDASKKSAPPAAGSKHKSSPAKPKRPRASAIAKQDAATSAMPDSKRSRNFRLRFMAGAGPTGLGIYKDGTGFKAGQTLGPIGAIGFDRKLSDDLSLGFQIQTNKSLLIGIGFDF